MVGYYQNINTMFVHEASFEPDGEVYRISIANTWPWNILVGNAFSIIVTCKIISAEHLFDMKLLMTQKCSLAQTVVMICCMEEQYYIVLCQFFCSIYKWTSLLPAFYLLLLSLLHDCYCLLLHHQCMVTECRHHLHIRQVRDQSTDKTWKLSSSRSLS